MNPVINRSFNPMQNQKGQGMLEAILLIVVLLGATQFVVKYLQSQQIAANLVAEPWGRLSGMIECGVWQTCKGAKGLHPQTVDRVISIHPKTGGG